MTEDELILIHILQCTRSELYFRKPQLTPKQQEEFESYKVRRQDGEPLQYILGVCDFMGVELKVDVRVLVPRPETEILVEHAVKLLSFPNVSIGGDKGIQILDLGTGSGNIAIALAKLLPAAVVTTVDVSKDALDLAKENAIKNGVEGRINFVHADMVSVILSVAKDLKAPLVPQKDSILFDFIISNPPYIPTAQMSQLPVDVQQEPCLALEAGEDGLRFYRDIIKHIAPLLRAGAYLMMEFGDNQGEAVKDLIIKQQEFSNIQILQDLNRKDRIICVQKI